MHVGVFSLDIAPCNPIAHEMNVVNNAYLIF